MPSTDAVDFFAFDPDADVGIRNRNLPHWFQPGVAIFITFRTLDSIPRCALANIQSRFKQWLVDQKLPIDFVEDFFNIVPEKRKCVIDSYPWIRRAEIARHYDRLFHQTLDDCHGECLLGKREAAEIVANALLYYNGEKYDLDSFVIMPNHIHAIAQFRSGFDLGIVGQSWMRYTARLIHSKFGGSGGFWQPEPFDHIVRSSEQFAYLRQYLVANPKKGHLKNGQFLYWSHLGGVVDRIDGL